VPLKPAKILDWIAAREQPDRSAATRPSAAGSGIRGGGSVVVHGDPQSVWAALLNEDNLRHAIPGCERLARIGPNAFDASVRLGVGPVSGQFEAHVGLFELEEPRSAVLRGDLSGSLAAASGEGRLALTAQEDGCRIDYRYNIHLSGRVAMIGGRMLDGAARHLINEFFQRFALSLGGRELKTSSLPWRMRLTRFLGAGR
jgi:2-furoyl-CoA dehydrogenase large subunit